jgi:hypothetical protein
VAPIAHREARQARERLQILQASYRPLRAAGGKGPPLIPRS